MKRMLTLEAMVWTVRSGGVEDAGIGRYLLRRPAAEVVEGEDARVGVGPPGPIPPVGREQRTRRSG